MSPRQAQIPGTSPSQRQRSSARKKIGTAAENRVEALNTACALAGVAWLHPGDTGLRPVGPPDGTGRVPCRGTRKGSVDFEGTLAGGRSVLVEVKHAGRESGRWDLDGLEDHQAETLDAHHRAGALCLLLVVGNGPLDLFAVPWPVVAGGPAAARPGRRRLPQRRAARPPPVPRGAPLPRPFPLERSPLMWVAVDVDLIEGPAMMGAVARVGDAARAAAFAAYGYTATYQTDGFIPRARVRSLTEHRHPAKVADALVEAGVWEVAEGGWRVVGYLKNNKSRAQLEEGRARDAARKSGGKGDGTPAESPRKPDGSDLDSNRNPSGIRPESAAESNRNPAGVQPPPSQTLPPRVQAQEQAQTPAETPQSPPGGVGGAPGVGSGRNPAGVQAGAGPDSGRSQRRLEAFREGISAATGKGWKAPPRLVTAYVEALDTAIEAHAGDLAGPELRAWVVDRARAFAVAHQGREQVVPGFAPEFFLKWLNAGATTPQASGAPARSRPVQQGRAGGGSFNPFANDPPETDTDEVAHAS